MMVTKEALALFEVRIKEYIADKNELERTELRDGMRGEATTQRLFNPAAAVKAISANIKNADPEQALWNRRKNLVHAEYLLKIIQSITSDLNNNSDDFTVELHRQMSDVGLDQESSYFKMLKIEAAKHSKPHANPHTKIEALWPYFLYSKVADECIVGANYSISRFRNVIDNINVDENDIDACFENVFQTMNAERGYQPLGYDPAALALNVVIENSDSPSLSELREKNQIPELGIGLSAIVQSSDELMQMELDPKRFSEWTLRGFEQDYPIGYQGKPLRDGWYQYVIVTEPKNQFRYFPCSPSNGGHIPYKKYISHSELSGNLPIYAAGAFNVKNGKITLIDDSSGHYKTNRSNVEYAREVLGHLGMENKSSVEISTMPVMNNSQELTKLKKKLHAASFGLIASKSSSSSAQTHTITAAAESRPIPPAHLRGAHLRNLQAEHRKLFYQQNVKKNGYTILVPTVHESMSKQSFGPDLIKLVISAPTLASNGALSPSVDDWCGTILKNFGRKGDCNHYVLEIKNFPPNAHEYYLQLQEEIAKLIPKEHFRPNICLHIKGNHVRSVDPYVGLIGGSGPLSDAVILGGWLGGRGSDIDDVHAVLFSFPPPRAPFDNARALHHVARYASILGAYSEKYPAQSNYLLSNSAHANIGLAQSLLSSDTGSIINMVEKVAGDIKKDARNGIKTTVFVLGTTAAANAMIYEDAFKDENNSIDAVLPEKDAQTDLQQIIDNVKEGKAAQAGNAFVAYVSEMLDAIYDKATHGYILLGCTELPLLLSTEDPESNENFSTKLKNLLKERGFNNLTFIDTEEKFITYIEEGHKEAEGKAKLLNNAHLVNLAIIAFIAPPMIIAGGVGIMFGTMLIGYYISGTSKESAMEHASTLVKSAAHDAWPYAAIFVGIGMLIGIGLYVAARRDAEKSVQSGQTENGASTNSVRFSSLIRLIRNVHGPAASLSAVAGVHQ
ncbi:MAG: aspartate/glutamate racemase family protein [Gammaproteobacteria bacterium]